MRSGEAENRAAFTTSRRSVAIVGAQYEDAPCEILSYIYIYKSLRTLRLSLHYECTMESSESRGFIPVILVGIIKKGANSTIRLMRSLPLPCNFFMLIYFENILHVFLKLRKRLALIGK